jgi:hypothetical protein
VYDALKAYNPALQVGGPYVVFDSYLDKLSNPSAIHGSWGRLDQRPLDVIKYWLAHKHGADFIAVDGGTGPKVADLGHFDAFNGVKKLVAVTKWLRSKTALPIWWSELYPCNRRMNVGAGGCAAVAAYALMALAQSGASVALLWQQPQPGGRCIGPCMWTDTQRATGGKLTPTGKAVLQVVKLLSLGTRIRRVGGLPSGVIGYAVGNRALLVNTQRRAVTITTLSGRLRLGQRSSTFTANLTSATG